MADAYLTYRIVLAKHSGKISDGTSDSALALSIDLARNVANGPAQVFVKSQVNGALRRTPLPFVRIQGLHRRMIKPASFIRNPRSIHLQL